MNNPRFGYIKLGCGHVVDQDAEDLECQECAENPPEDKQYLSDLHQAYGAGMADLAETRAAGEALAEALRGLANIATHPKCTMADRQLFAREAREALAQWEEVTK